MTNALFNRLADFLQEYIYANNWQGFRQVQVEACRVIFDTNAHLLLAAGTASGKTEAAFLPVLTLLDQNPPATVGVLYISPIKALINDQFSRLSEILRKSCTPVYAWHGDVGSSHKRRLLRNPQGILQITPESLESLLINQPDEIERLFGELRFVVIDEIHAFMGSERGNQVLCQLARIARRTKNQPRRIGLSATLGDYSLAEAWLQGGTKNEVITPEIEGKGQSVRLAVEHFYRTPEDREQEFSYIYHNSKGTKCLIFTNNRTESEAIISNLREKAAQESLPDIYHVHHGSISAMLREDAEAAMRGENPAVIAATVTLEMGIDLGQLERVIQLNSPVSVSSFLQRLGRTGRRGSAADMRIVCTEDEVDLETLLPQRIPWDLLSAIAIIQLYLEDRWIEPIKARPYPYSLLYHQTLSIVTAKGELSPTQLAEEVLTLPPFTNVSQDDFRQLLHYLISIDHLQKTPKGNLILGITGEKIARNFRFYAVFSGNVEYKVRNESGEIGTVAILPNLGTTFTLAGRTWEVIDIEEKRSIIFVKPVSGSANSFWRSRGEGEKTHPRILQRMQQVLLENVEYPYLLSGAKKRLKAVRQLAKFEDLTHNFLIPLDEKTYCLFPWLGTIGFQTLERFLNVYVRTQVDIKSIKAKSPYYFIMKLGQAEEAELINALKEGREKALTETDLINTVEAPYLYKYDKFIPHNLLRHAFAKDQLDMEEVKQFLQKLRAV
jgi:ATP-dependent Lhr-like helicase